jgi:hypothetical protein
MRATTRVRHALIGAVLLSTACAREDDPTGPSAEPVAGTYDLVSENGRALPSDPSAPYGCCRTLSGSLTLSASTYDLRTTHRNKNNGITFENSEQGTYTRDGNTLAFTRTGGGGAGYPYLLGPATVDGATVTLLYGDEGPGSDQIRATFRRR